MNGFLEEVTVPALILLFVLLMFTTIVGLSKAVETQVNGTTCIVSTGKEVLYTGKAYRVKVSSGGDSTTIAIYDGFLWIAKTASYTGRNLKVVCK